MKPEMNEVLNLVRRGVRYRMYEGRSAFTHMTFVRVGEGNSTQSVVAAGGRLTGFYYDAMAEKLKDCKDVLLLGMGCGSIARVLDRWPLSGRYVTGVEPDRTMRAIAGLLDIADFVDNVVPTDAVSWLIECAENDIEYDGIAIDCFVGEQTPADLEKIRILSSAVLRESGRIVENVYAGGKNSVINLT